VTLIEKGRCGSEASWAGAGVLTPCNPHRHDGVAALRDESLAIYPKFCRQLHEESGIDPEFDPCGEIDLALDESSHRSLRLDVEAGANQRLPDGSDAYVYLNPQETRRIEPAATGEILGSMHCRRTAQVRNPRLLAALQRSCGRLHVEIRQGVEVHGFMEKSGRVHGVKTSQGAVDAAITILCAGAWSSSFDGQLHDVMPVIPVRGQMILLKFEERPFRHVIARGKTYLVPRRDGHVLLGATEEPGAGYVKRTTAAGISGLIAKGMKLIPAIGEAPVVATWAGLRPGTPDENPYLGPVPGFEGLIAATGHFRSGLILAPVTAEVITAFVEGRSPEHDVHDCRPGRSRGVAFNAAVAPMTGGAGIP